MKQFIHYFKCPVCGHKEIAQWDSIHGIACEKCGKILNEPHTTVELPDDELRRKNDNKVYDIKQGGIMYPSRKKAKELNYKFL